MATFCPYCDKEIEDTIQREWAGDYVKSFEFECPECGKTMDIDIEMEPVFLSHRKNDNKKEK